MRELIRKILKEEYTGVIDYSYDDMKKAFLDVFSDNKEMKHQHILKVLLVYTP